MDAKQTQEEITVQVLKHDGSEYRRWSARVVGWEGPLIVLDAQFDVDVTHDLLGEIRRGARTIEYYWLDRWYCVFRFLENNESTRLWYCNINTPPVLREHMLTYIDLDIDIIVQPDFSYQVLDVEEFEKNAQQYGYSDYEHAQVHAAVDELISVIATRQFPFEFSSATSLVS